MAVDEFERQAIAKMSHQELIAFVEEMHYASYGGAYVRSAIFLLIFVVAVEAVALAIRLIAGLFAAGKPSGPREDEFLPERAGTFP